MPHSAIARRGTQKTGTPLDPVPGRPVHYRVQALVDGTSKDQVVDGSVTPVEFDYAPASDISYVESIIFIIDDNGNVPPDKYAGRATALANGTQVLVQSQGTEYEISNLQDNSDISAAFVRSGFSAGGGWMASANLYFGELVFFIPMILNFSDGDYVRIKVRDDISKLNYQLGYVKFWRQI